MKITVKNKEYDSGKITRSKYKKYSTVRDKLTSTDFFTDEDLDGMVASLVDLFGKQFTEDDINEDFEISDIIYNFSRIDFEIGEKVNKKIESTKELFMKDKK